MFIEFFIAGASVLAMPPERQALESIERRVTGAFPVDGKLLVLPLEKPFLVRTPLAPDGKTRAEVFGKMIDAERLTVTKASGVDWRGADHAAGKTLLLDAEQLTLYETDPATLAEVTRRGVAWDLLKPPPDPRGEPTSGEVAAARARFKTAFLDTRPPRFTGLARLPAGWLGTKGRAYVVATRLKGFPLVVMACAESDAGACQVVRHCHVEKASDLAPESVSGIAVSAKRKEIVIGDARGHALRVFDARSCYNLPQTKVVKLPAKLETLTNVHIDAAERLWVATDLPDDYHNASVFFWEDGAW